MALIKKQNQSGDKEQPSFCKFTDLYTIDLPFSMAGVISIANEHGFRGICVHQGYVSELFESTKFYSDVGQKFPIIIAAIDHPYGTLSTEVRAFATLSAIEKGAKEIDICAPYDAFYNGRTGMIEADIKTIGAIAKEHNVKVNYTINPSCISNKPKTTPWLAKVLKSSAIQYISTSISPLFGPKDTSDTIIWLRDMKKFGDLNIKSYIHHNNLEDVKLYTKAGANILACNWSVAANLIHSYDEFLQSPINNNDTNGTSDKV